MTHLDYPSHTSLPYYQLIQSSDDFISRAEAATKELLNIYCLYNTFRDVYIEWQKFKSRAQWINSNNIEKIIKSTPNWDVPYPPNT